MLNIQNLLFALKTISAALGSCVIFFLSFGSCFDSIYVISYVSILLLSVVSHRFLVFVSLLVPLSF